MLYNIIYIFFSFSFVFVIVFYLGFEKRKKVYLNRS